MNEEILNILCRCCDKFSVTETEVKSKSTKLEVVNCRKAFAKIVKSKFSISNKTIGTFINKKHNSVYCMLSNEWHDKKFDKAVAELMN